MDDQDLSAEARADQSFETEVQQDLPKKQQHKRLLFYAISAVIIGFLILLALPNYLGAGGDCRPPSSSVKANMHTVQTMVETYAVDWGGIYPATLKALEIEAKKTETTAYWKEITNPITGYTGVGRALIDMGQSPQEGVVVYQAVYAKDPSAEGKTAALSYVLYGYEKATERIQDKGRDYFLSNS